MPNGAASDLTRSGTTVCTASQTPRVEASQRALDEALLRDRVRHPAGMDLTPYDAEPSAGVGQARQQPRQLGDDCAERVDEISGQMRAGRVTTRTVHRRPGSGRHRP